MKKNFFANLWLTFHSWSPRFIFDFLRVYRKCLVERCEESSCYFNGNMIVMVKIYNYRMIKIS